MNSITRKTAKELGIDFNMLLEDFSEHSYQEHRRGSSFYQQSIIEINKKWFPEVSRKYDGYWETNSYVWDDNYGCDKSDITELNRVEKVEKIVKTTEWVSVK